MSGKKYPLRRHYHQLFASSGLAALRSEPVPQDHRWCVQRLTAEGDKVTSGGNTRSRVHIEQGAIKYYLTEQDAPAADRLYELREEFHVDPGERVVLEWDQAQAATNLTMILTGYYTQADEGVV